MFKNKIVSIFKGGMIKDVYLHKITTPLLSSSESRRIYLFIFIVLLIVVMYGRTDLPDGLVNFCCGLVYCCCCSGDAVGDIYGGTGSGLCGVKDFCINLHKLNSKVVRIVSCSYYFFLLKIQKLRGIYTHSPRCCLSWHVCRWSTRQRRYLWIGHGLWWKR